MQPSDIDFACSWTFYRGISCLHGWGDPGPNIPEPAADYSELENRIANLEGKRGQVYQSIKSGYRMAKKVKYVVIPHKPQKPKRGFNL